MARTTSTHSVFVDTKARRVKRFQLNLEHRVDDKSHAYLRKEFSGRDADWTTYYGKRPMQFRKGFADDWDTTDWNALGLEDALMAESDKMEADRLERECQDRRARERAALAERMRLEDNDPRRPPKGIFSSKSRKVVADEPTDPVERVERVTDDEHAMRAHVGWPSPAHKPRKVQVSDPNPYGKPRFRSTVPAQFRSTDSVGGMGYVRSGKVRKIA